MSNPMTAIVADDAAQRWLNAVLLKTVGGDQAVSTRLKGRRNPPHRSAPSEGGDSQNIVVIASRPYCAYFSACGGTVMHEIKALNAEKVETVVAEALVDRVVDTNAYAAPRDGKVFVSPIGRAVRIRSGDTDETAL